MPEDISEKIEIFELCEAVLFRHHAIKMNSSLIKDLSKLGRDISSVMIIDEKK